MRNLNNIEVEILKIVDQIINKNKVLNLNSLQNIAKKQLNYSDKEISKAIYSLILNKIIIPEKKITINSVLDNNRRKTILNYIENNPGAHLREIRDNLSISPQITNWHLKILENFQFIRTKKYLKYRIFFPKNFDQELEEPLLALKNDNALDLLINIYNFPNNDSKKIKKLINIAPNVFEYHLNSLLNSGIIFEKEQDNKKFYEVNQDKFRDIHKYLNIIFDGEKIKKEIPIKPGEVEEIGLIRIKRAFDYVGGNVRFKVVVENKSNEKIRDISVSLNVKKQFETNLTKQDIDFLDPNESRGSDFILTPLTCGKSTISGEVTYLDSKDQTHSATVKPSLVQVKCPLVIPKQVALENLIELKDQLQKSHTEIKYTELNVSKAFDIAREQISSLDVIEIDKNEKAHKILYSGEAKIGGDQIIIELIVRPQIIFIDVYLKDLEQATGFLAYIKNLITLSLQYSKQISTTLDKITSKVYNALEFGLRLLELYYLCEKKGTLDEVIILLKELKIKSDSYFPNLKLIESFNNRLNDFEKIKDGKIWDRTYINLQFDILDWLEKIIIFSETQSKNYFELPSASEETCKNIENGNLKLKEELKAKNEQYEKKILFTLMVIDKAGGLNLYNHNFAQESLDSDLISGFLTAIQSFGAELSGEKEESSMTSLAYQNFQIALDDREKIRAALILKGPPTAYITKKLKDYLGEFESNFKDELERWAGNISLFKPADELIKRIFG